MDIAKVLWTSKAFVISISNQLEITFEVHRLCRWEIHTEQWWVSLLRESRMMINEMSSNQIITNLVSLPYKLAYSIFSYSLIIGVKSIDARSLRLAWFDLRIGECYWWRFFTEEDFWLVGWKRLSVRKILPHVESSTDVTPALSRAEDGAGIRSNAFLIELHDRICSENDHREWSQIFALPLN